MGVLGASGGPIGWHPWEARRLLGAVLEWSWGFLEHLGSDHGIQGARDLVNASRSLLGYILGAFWRPLGASWGSLGGPEGFLAVLGASGGPLGAAWGALGSLLGASGGHHGAILGPSWGLLEPPGRLLGPSWRTSIKEERGFNYSPPSGAP